jgi:hypothetical protein
LRLVVSSNVRTISVYAERRELTSISCTIKTSGIHLSNEGCDVAEVCRNFRGFHLHAIAPEVEPEIDACTRKLDAPRHDLQLGLR